MAAAVPAESVLALLQTRRSFLGWIHSPSPPHSLLLYFRGFCTARSPDLDHGIPAVESTPPAEDGVKQRRRRHPERSEPLHETICYMMAKHPWTTHLQNSIRSLLCPSSSFDQELIVAVVRGARESDHSLRFFRWVEKMGFLHDRVTYGEIVSLLSRHRMLNHAR